MTDLDTEIRRAMGELVRATPMSLPARGRDTYAESPSISRSTSSTVLTDPPSDSVLQLIGPEHRRRRVSAFIVAASLIAAALAVLVVRIDGTSESTTVTSRQSHPPAWYTTVRPFVPDRYTTISLQQFTAQLIRFIAVDPDSATTLDYRISRVPIPADPSGNNLPHIVDNIGEWFDFADGFNVVNHAGLQAQVTCYVIGFPGDGQLCSDMTNYSLTTATLRAVTARFASDFPATTFTSTVNPKDLATTTETIDRLVSDAVPNMSPMYNIELPASRVAAYTTIDPNSDGLHSCDPSTQDQDNSTCTSLPEQLRVTITSGFFPALDVSPIRSLQTPQHFIDWSIHDGRLIVTTSSLDLQHSDLLVLIDGLSRLP